MTRVISFTDVVYREWVDNKKGKLAVELLPKRKKIFDRIMEKVVGEFVGTDAKVDVNHRIVNPAPTMGAPYDVIDIRIEIP